MRYQLQVNEVRVDAPLGDYDEAATNGLVRAFEDEYERLFGAGSGYAAAGFALSAARVGARARVSDFEIRGRDNGHRGTIEPVGRRDVTWYEHGTTPIATPVFRGEHLRRDAPVQGPAIVEFVDTTLVLRDGQVADVDRLGSVVIDV